MTGNIYLPCLQNVFTDHIARYYKIDNPQYGLNKRLYAECSISRVKNIEIKKASTKQQVLRQFKTLDTDLKQLYTDYVYRYVSTLNRSVLDLGDLLVLDTTLLNHASNVIDSNVLAELTNLQIKYLTYCNLVKANINDFVRRELQNHNPNSLLYLSQEPSHDSKEDQHEFRLTHNIMPQKS